MTHLLIVCKDCRHEVWMTPRDYIKWRCPLCNGYPAVREARRDKITEVKEVQRTEDFDHGGVCCTLESNVAADLTQALIR